VRGVQEDQLSNQSQQKKDQGEAFAQKVLSKMPEAYAAQRDKTTVEYFTPKVEL